MSGKKTSKSKIRNTLIVIGIIAVAVAAAYILLFMPLANVPSWMSDIRNAFYGSASIQTSRTISLPTSVICI